MSAQPQSASSRQGAQAGGQSFGNMGYRTYVLLSLTFVYTLNFIDRILISVVGRPIIDEFSLSNFQFGILSGIGFALFYTTLGIPIASLSDRYNRVRIIAVCIFIWSLATVMCGLTVGFFTLLLSRLAVGIGEAGCSPPANSLISDYYKPAARPTALGVYAMGVMLGSVLAQLSGGYILKFFSWREAFIFVGAPGFLVAIIIFFTIKEPPRGFSNPPGAPKPKRANLKDALAELLTKRTFWVMAAGSSMMTFAGYGMLSFKPLYIQYTFGLTPGETAIYFMSVISFAGAIGPPLAGRLTQYLATRTKTAATLAPAVCLVSSAPFLAYGFLAPTLNLMLASFSISALLQYTYLGAQFNITQAVVSVQMRATALAILLFIINLVGYGGGPPLIGLLADVLTTHHLAAGDMNGILDASCNLSDPAMGKALIEACTDAKAYGIKWASVYSCVLFVFAGTLFHIAGRTLNRDSIVG